MQITVQLPDDLTQHADPAREPMEALAIAGYRSGALSSYETRFELDGFLKKNEVWEHS
jgi:hypothetical protein